jgi:hypothetical protein
MFSLFATNVRLARPVLTVAKYAFLNPVTRSFITSSRVADAEPKAASSEPTIEKKSKREKKDSKPQQKDKPKISKLFSITDTRSILTRLAVVITKDVKPPKRPLTPYTRFVKEYYDTHPKTFSREGIATEMKRCGADWNALSDAAKAVRFYLTRRSNTDGEHVDRHIQKVIMKHSRNIVRREQHGLKA